MFTSATKHLSRGYTRVRDNTQLRYTILVALVIIAAFVFITLRFTGIARDAQERLTNVRAGSLQDAITVFDPDIVFTNPEQLEGELAKLSFINETVREFTIVVFEDGRPIITASLNRDEIGEEDQKFAYLYSIARADPDRSFTVEDIVSDRRVFQTVRIVENEQGEVIGALRISQTLSEADRRIEENIRDSLIIFIFVLLFVMLLFFRHARLVDYAELYKKLKEVDGIKDEFIAMVTHELRTPVTIIRGYVDLLKVDDSLSSDAQTSVSRIDTSAQQLEGLIGDMFDVSKLEQGRMSFSFARINLDDVVLSVVDGFREQASRKGIICEYRAGTELFVFVDEQRVRQALVNVLGNAIKYTQKGSVHITLTKEQDDVVVRVSDTGIGMTARERERLFEKFYRAQNSDTQGVRGTGLGLWLTRRLVEEMGGSIEVESIRGIGTHMILRFPRASEPVHEEANDK